MFAYKDVFARILNENADMIKDGYLSCNGAIETYDIKETKQLPHMEKPDEVAERCSIYLS